MIVHYVLAEKFTEPFIDFIERNFQPGEHVFLVQENGGYLTSSRPNVVRLDRDRRGYRKVLTLIRYFNSADKVICHGLFDPVLLICLFLQPWLLKRSYWVIWGGDLYRRRSEPGNIRAIIGDKLRKSVIRRLGHLVTYLDGDYELAKLWYDATGSYHVCYLYPSNLFTRRAAPVKAAGPLNVLVGNSADSENNHVEVFEQLRGLNEECRIYCPLSYGSAEYADVVTRAGTSMFGDRFVALRTFMSFEEYYALLNQMDVAVFAHRRQQAMGTTITLLGLGKRVYMRTDVSQWALLRAKGIAVFDLEHMDLSSMESESAQRNTRIVSDEFSEAHLKAQWQDVFNGASS